MIHLILGSLSIDRFLKSENFRRLSADVAGVRRRLRDRYEGIGDKIPIFQLPKSDGTLDHKI